MGGGGKKWAVVEQAECKCSPDIAVGSSDYPVRADERTATKVEASAVLGSEVRCGSELRLFLGVKHLGPCSTPAPGVCVPAGTPARARSPTLHSPR